MFLLLFVCLFCALALEFVYTIIIIVQNLCGVANGFTKKKKKEEEEEKL